MFTGIIEAQGEIKSVVKRGDDARFHIVAGALDMADVQLGDSIAIEGVCLTVVQFDATSFMMDASLETLSKTTLGEFKVGRKVNLEKALLPTTRLGGHLVSGHIDGVAEIVSRRQVGESIRFEIKLPDALAKYVAVKGSICIDGVSLTVNNVDGAVFDVNVIPHTAVVTTIALYQPGSKVNIEVDLIARYLERLLLGEKAAESLGGIDKAFLVSHGFQQD